MSHEEQNAPSTPKDEAVVPNGAIQPVTDLGDHSDIDRLLKPGSQRRQELMGFDEDYVDIVDYIVRCTHKIWEEGAVGLIYSHYRHNAKVHTSSGSIYGRERVVASTLETLSAFPDRKLYADDVIWSGNDQVGFHTSHRVVSTATNTGYGQLGPPTGRRVIFTTMAHCFVKENRIVEEWLARDNMAIVLQLGLDPHEVARRAAQMQQAQPTAAQFAPTGEIDRVLGQTTPDLSPSVRGEAEIEEFVCATLHEIWNWRLFNRIGERFVDNYVCNTVRGHEIYGRGDYKTFIIGLLATLPDAKLVIDHICHLGDDVRGFRVAVRWTLLGTNTGYSHYGDPTGKRVRVLGVSHFSLRGGKFVAEWMIFDELALLTQLYA